MTRRRWIADEVSGNRAALVGAHAQHLAQVLRGRVGQEFDIATGDSVRRGRIISITDDRVEFELGEVIPAAPTPNLTLVLSIFKFDRMEWAIEKCVELGASRIVPVVAQRTEAHLAKAAAEAGGAMAAHCPAGFGAVAAGVSAGNLAAAEPACGGDRVPAALASCWLSPKNR